MIPVLFIARRLFFFCFILFAININAININAIIALVHGWNLSIHENVNPPKLPQTSEMHVKISEFADSLGC